MRWTVDVYADRYQDADGEGLWRFVDQLLTEPTREKTTVLVG
jgi:hypothetical protein